MSDFQWTRLIATCRACGASWEAPRDEPHECPVARLQEAGRESCREELGEEHGFHRCGEPAEFILWGKLLKPEALGPRCYDHAAEHVGHSALAPNSGWAVFDLRPFIARDLSPAEAVADA